MQLHRAGLLSQVETIIAGLAADAEIVIAWQKSTKVRRDSPTVASLAWG